MGPGIDFPLVMNYSDTEMPNGASYFYFLSGHNDVAYFSNSTFDDFETYEYNPWGILLTSASKNNLLYTSREFDFETGLQFNRMRYYLPNLGRFIIKDLIYSKNLYLYAKNKPLRLFDPFGLFGDIIRGVCPDEADDEIKICLEGCEITLENDLDACDIKFDAAIDYCWDTYNNWKCGEKGEGFSFKDMDCEKKAAGWLEDCIRHSNEERAACYDEAYAVFESCLYKCFGLLP
jgi:RHS repeat-associated protein